MEERLEIADTVEAVRRELEDLVVRGLRTAGPGDLQRLGAMQEELERAGARHLAGRLQALLGHARADDPGGARALMDVLTTLRVFERVLTLDTVAVLLEADEVGLDDGEGDDDDEADHDEADHDEADADSSGDDE